MVLSGIVWASLVARDAPAQQHVLTRDAEATVRSTFSRIPPPCGASLRSVRIDRTRLTLVYERPDFEVTLVHPTDGAAGLVAGPYRVLDGRPPGCPGAPSELAGRLAEIGPRDPWTELAGPPRAPDAPARALPLEGELSASARSVVGGLLLLVHVVLVGALLLRLARRTGTSRERLWRAAWPSIAAAGMAARWLAPHVVFNWYSATPDGNLATLLVSQGAVGLQQVLDRPWMPGAGFDRVVGFVSFSAGLSAGLAVPLAEAAGVPRRGALLTGVALALWPALVRMGASDAPHPIALTLWMALCLAWARLRTASRTGPPRRAALEGAACGAALVVLGAGLALVRSEAVAWLPAAIALLPPGRKTPRPAWVALALSAAASVVFALPGLREAGRLEGGSLGAVSLGPWLAFAFTAARGLSVAPLVVESLVALGVVVMAASSRSLALRWGAAALLLALPALVGEHAQVDPLTLRYVLPLAFLTLLAAVTGLSKVADLLAPRPGAVAATFVVALCAAEARSWLSPDAQYTFRREASFLRSTLAGLPADARVCMLDPAMNQDWPGPHVDFDAAWSPRGGGRYLGAGDKLRVATAASAEGRCSFYYESTACFLDPEARRFQPDVDRLVSECAAWRERLGPVVAEERVPALTYGAPFEPGLLWLRVFRVRPAW